MFIEMTAIVISHFAKTPQTGNFWLHSIAARLFCLLTIFRKHIDIFGGILPPKLAFQLHINDIECFRWFRMSFLSNSFERRPWHHFTSIAIIIIAITSFVWAFLLFYFSNTFCRCFQQFSSLLNTFNFHLFAGKLICSINWCQFRIFYIVLFNFLSSIQLHNKAILIFMKKFHHFKTNKTNFLSKS